MNLASCVPPTPLDPSDNPVPDPMLRGRQGSCGSDCSSGSGHGHGYEAPGPGSGPRDWPWTAAAETTGLNVAKLVPRSGRFSG